MGKIAVEFSTLINLRDELNRLGDDIRGDNWRECVGQIFEIANDLDATAFGGETYDELARNVRLNDLTGWTPATIPPGFKWPAVGFVVVQTMGERSESQVDARNGLVQNWAGVNGDVRRVAVFKTQDSALDMADYLPSGAVFEIYSLHDGKRVYRGENA